MGRKCCQSGCYSACLVEHKAMLLQLEYMIEQARRSKQDFMVYLLEMAAYETQAIIDCAKNEAKLQCRMQNSHSGVHQIESTADRMLLFNHRP